MVGPLSPGTPLYGAWSAAADLVLVNLLTLLGCLPLVTAGASLTACSRVTMEMVREEEGYVVRTWWRSFRSNLVQSLTWWVPVLLLGALALWENRVLSQAEVTASASGAGAVSGLLVAGLLSVAAVLVWLVPLTAFFDNRTGTHLANAVRLAVGHLGRTVLCLLALAAPVALVALVPDARVATAWFMVLIGVAFTGYLVALVERGVIDRLRDRARGL